MKSQPDPARFEASEQSAPILDLNDLLLEHPAASFIFQIGQKLAIVDRAGIPSDGCLVLIKTSYSYIIALYTGQEAWGVVTYLIDKTF